MRLFNPRQWKGIDLFGSNTWYGEEQEQEEEEVVEI